MPFCTSCGKEITENIKFCGNCGAAMQSNVAQSSSKNDEIFSVPPQENRWGIFSMAYLFGSFGIHCFIAQKYVKGIFYLLATIIYSYFSFDVNYPMFEVIRTYMFDLVILIGGYGLAQKSGTKITCLLLAIFFFCLWFATRGETFDFKAFYLNYPILLVLDVTITICLLIDIYKIARGEFYNADKTVLYSGEAKSTSILTGIWVLNLISAIIGFAYIFLTL